MYYNALPSITMYCHVSQYITMYYHVMPCITMQGSKLKKMSGRKFATSYENLVATLKMLVAKLIEAI